MSSFWDVNSPAAMTIPTPGADGTVLTASGGAPVWQAASGAGAPTGTVIMWPTATAPSGYLLCDGSAVSRTTYAALYALIGTTYGTGDGSTTFNLPDLQGRVAVGKGTHADVNAVGKSDGVAVASRRPAHKHSVGTVSHTLGFSGTAGNTGTDFPDHTHSLYQGATATAARGFPARSADSVVGQTDGASARHQHGFTPAGTITGGINTPTVGPQTGSEPTDNSAYLVLNFAIKT